MKTPKKPIVEKKTGEKYASKAAMAKHERTEGKKEMIKEYGKQGYNARMNESLAARNGKKTQSLKDRRDEAKGMNKKMTGKAYSSVKTMGKKK